ncbi:tRNA (adenosine(37)-N6)-dimethylallyltransferase MiaA [Hyphomicrobium sp.]|mgnify:FL=1|uniref:tRNA (adenosine(37)-N6)-dimethylallyltransferase MiaA n=1 Tax=Hyphomicrobium sp. TaxID=82 RepID=UPI002CF3D219|nr:tRNA (adenosine(37)-N6)-dimethylallyltransferase MiaA [Hyphomicrobium sp.]HRN88713.1 tRNA (adenosine(37)-N6)-dimethylallyltransferase MiaA [Hyphomicrobium sp.]HRQ25868.1 tRNA (adenosine(37)-N6)-dimethylallyltransferase MiaA [Hyphomicrobium sp.]
MNKTVVILIAGPTASGKSALAHALAERLSGTVINADSMQVYRELRILTARPSEAETAAVPYRLYGHVPGHEAYSAARYADEARSAIAEAQAAGRIPVVVGGTGLYFKALLEGLSPIPPIPPDIRTRWRDAAAEQGAAALHAVLAKRDPVMAARLRPSDPQRIVRALEVLEATGISLAAWQEMPGEPVIQLDEALPLVVSPPREVLRQRIDARFDAMIEEGATEEVRALARLGLDPDLPLMRALGVRPLMDMLAGRVSAIEAVEGAKAETRQYAKRQVTWLRSNMSAWKWQNAQDMESLSRHFCDIIKA